MLVASDCLIGMDLLVAVGLQYIVRM